MAVMEQDRGVNAADVGERRGRASNWNGWNAAFPPQAVAQVGRIA